MRQAASLSYQNPSREQQHQPFIGYIEFLWEKQIRGHERLQQLKINLSYSRGGKAPIPAGHKDADFWRFKAAGE